MRVLSSVLSDRIVCGSVEMCACCQAGSGSIGTRTAAGDDGLNANVHKSYSSESQVIRAKLHSLN